MFHYLFSFKGRTGRAGIWLFIPVVLAWFLSFQLGLQRLVVPVARDYGLVGKYGLILLWTVPILYAYFAVFVKRLHDRGWSGWWFIAFWVTATLLTAPGLIYMWRGVAAEELPQWVTACQWVVLILYVWLIAELFALRGTKGDNRFGPDPLALKR